MSNRPPALEDVCSLDALSLQERLDFIRREIAPLVVRREFSEGRAAWEFAESPPVRDTLEGLIELERDCCATWRFELDEVPDANRLRLSVEGDGAGSALVEVLGDSDSDEPAAARRKSTGKLGLALRAGGLGFLVSFTVCCILPLAAAAVFGGSVLAVAVYLDTPLAIAIGTLGFGAIAWRMQSKRV
jgi:hypothetical protein